MIASLNVDFRFDLRTGSTAVSLRRLVIKSERLKYFERSFLILGINMHPERFSVLEQSYCFYTLFQIDAFDPRQLS